MQSGPTSSNDMPPARDGASTPVDGTTPALESGLGAQVTPDPARNNFAHEQASFDSAAFEELISNYAESIMACACTGNFYRRRSTAQNIADELKSTRLSQDTWHNLELRELIHTIAHCSPKYTEVTPETARNFRMTDDEGLQTIETLALNHSIKNLPTEYDLIKDRQDALRELGADKLLCEALNRCLSSDAINSIFSVMDGPGGSFSQKYYPATIGAWYNQNRMSLSRLSDDLQRLPEPRSRILQEALNQLRLFLKSETARIHTVGARVGLQGVVPADEPKSDLFSFRFRPLVIHPIRSLPYYAPVMIAIGGTAMMVTINAQANVLGAKMLGLSAIAMATSFLLTVAGGATLKSRFAEDITSKARRDATKAIGAFSFLRELLALDRFTRTTTQPTSFLRLMDLPEATFAASNMGSPLHSQHENFVLNDAEVADSDPSVIVGPNSAGKTTWLKAICCNWLLAQLGAKCFATSGSFSPLSKLVLSSPKQNNSTSEHGRFGEELKWLRPLLDIGVDSRTVLLFDEIGSGTAEGASAAIATSILRTLKAHDCRVIVATHNYPLKNALESSSITVHPLHPEIVLLQGADGSTLADSTHVIRKGYPPAEVRPEYGAWHVMGKIGLSSLELEKFEQEARRRQQD